MVHHQPGHTAVSIGPRVNGYQSIVGLETEIVAFRGWHRLRTLFIDPVAEFLQFCRDLLVTQIGPSTDSGRDIQQTKVSVSRWELSQSCFIGGARVHHDQAGKTFQHFYGDIRMAFSNPDTFFIGLFQVQIHHLFWNGLSFRGDSLVKQQLVFNFRHRRAFDGRGMGNERVEIELLSIPSFLYCSISVMSFSIAFIFFSILFSAKIGFSPYFSKWLSRIFESGGFGITSLKAQILSKSSRKKFDITPVAGTKKARMFLTGLFLCLSRGARRREHFGALSCPGTCSSTPRGSNCLKNVPRHVLGNYSLPYFLLTLV